MRFRRAMLLVGLVLGLLTACGHGETPMPTVNTPVLTEKNPETATPGLQQGETIVPTEIIAQGTEDLPVMPSIRDADGMELIEIPAGKTWIGCFEENNGGFACNSDELPVHQVSLDGFWIDKFEVSNGQFSLCVRAGACEPPYYLRSSTRGDYYGNAEFDRYPRVSVSWHEAQEYCQWVGGRLPTEAEWVRAARGGDQRLYPWGDEKPSCELANTLDERTGKLCVGDTSPVGEHPLGASPFGVMDMAGNVWEWTADWYHKDYYSFSPLDNPQGPEQGGTKVVHGGSFDYGWERLRIAYTSDHDPREHKIGFGFRCVMDALDWE